MIMSFSTDKITPFSGNQYLPCGNNILDLSSPVVMGILNVTPDSFYDGGRYYLLDKQIAQAEKMISEGAAIIDIGAASTRPYAEEVSEAEELKRLLPALEILVKRFPNIIFSVDTFWASVAEASADLGAGIINDISGGTFDENLLRIVSQKKLTYVLMHIQGTPKNMQQNPQYENVVLEIIKYFQNKIHFLQEIEVNNIILDLGFGFGKTIEHNYIILKKMMEFQEFELPILVGLSRKSMLYKPLNITPQEALNATTAAHTIALLNGAKILRVHDVKEAVEAIKIVAKLTDSITFAERI